MKLFNIHITLAVYCVDWNDAHKLGHELCEFMTHKFGIEEVSVSADEVLNYTPEETTPMSKLKEE